MTYPAGRQLHLDTVAHRGLTDSAEWAGTRIGQFLEHVAAAASLSAALLGLYPALQGWPEDLVVALEGAQLVAELSGRYDARPGGPLGYASDADPFDLPFDAAVQWFASREVVTASELRELRGAARARAFYVGGVEDRRLADRFHREIASALEEGTGLADFVEAMDEAASSLGQEPFALGRLSTVFRNATASAYQSGRYAQQMAEVESRPIWEYHALPGARPAHAAMDGTRLPADHPFWDLWFPPNDHNCRCSTESLTREEAGPLTELDMTTLERPGWAESPARAPQATVAADAVAGELQLAVLPSTRLARAELLESSGEALSRRHSAAMDALDRGQDASRLASLQAQVGLVEGELEQLLVDAPRVHLHPPIWRAERTGVVAELALPAQDGAGLEELARRLQHAPELAGVTLRVRRRVTVARGGSSTAPATHILDAELAAELGDAAPVAWVGEAVLEVADADAARLDVLRRFLVDHTRPGGDASRIPFAGDQVDLRLSAVGVGDAVLNVRELEGGWRASTVSSRPLPGWNPHPVAQLGEEDPDA